MADPQLTPSELDRVEDALEALEFNQDIDDSSEAVRQLLTDYRQVLQVSREALPLEDVSPGVLSKVLAAAHDSPAVAAPGPAAQPSLWTKIRRSVLVPALALAGAAALVLLIVQPGSEDAATVMEPDAAAPVATPVEADVERKTADEFARSIGGEAEQGDAIDGRGEQAEAAAEALPEEELPTDAAAKEAPALAPSAAPPSPATAVPGSGSTAPTGSPPAVAAEVSDHKTKLDASKTKSADPDDMMWDAVLAGDRLRRRGRCTAARSRYNEATGATTPRIKARAIAGLGLCDDVDGKSTMASGRFSEARGLYPDVFGFIARERAAQRAGASPTNRKGAKPMPKRSKKKRKAAPPNAAKE